MNDRFKKAFIINFGCKLNQFEGEALKQALKGSGIEARIIHPSEIKGYDDGRALFIINTCTVTSKSDRKSRNAIYRVVGVKKKGDLLIVTGCYAQTDRIELESIEGVDLVLDNLQKPRIPDIVNMYGYNAKSNVEYMAVDRESDIFSYTDPLDINRSRVFVKVQDGCDMRCSYCKIPLARGKSISRSYYDVVDYVKRIEELGYNEIVLTGINLGSYMYWGKDLAGLIEEILKNTSSIGIRLSSIEPMYFKKGLFDIIGDSRVAPHFHIPLQSGSDRILRAMRRPYTAEKFVSIVDKIRESKPNVHIATDIIVGFPGETEIDFEKSCNLMEELRFSSVHVFKYSPRKGTEAYSYTNNVPEIVKSERSEVAHRLADKLNYKFRKNFEGKVRDAIIEKHEYGCIAVTDNYIKVLLRDSRKDCKPRMRVKVRIERVTSGQTTGEVVSVNRNIVNT